MSLLRNYIRGIILSEGMIKPESIENHFAIWTDWTPGSNQTRKHFVLYDTRKAKQNIMNFYPGRLDAMDGMWRWVYVTDLTPGPWQDMDQAVVATMSCRDYSQLSNSCGGAWEVTTSAAIGGHGPTLYDLVMSISPGGLFSDRSSVSSEAHGVWEFYANNRPDIEKKVMDGSRITPYDNTDDCYPWDEYQELMGTASRERVIDFMKNKMSLWTMIDPFYEDVDEDIDGIPIDKTHGKNFFLAFRDWFKQEIRPDTAEMEKQWIEWQKTHPVIDYVKWQLTDPQYLDIIYNTDYAVGSAKKMIANHDKMLEDLADNGIDWGSRDAMNRGFSKIPKEFFDEHYHG